MTRLFRDSVNPDEIPLDGIDGVFLYANGKFVATSAEAERFTKAGLAVARIDVNGEAPHLASVLDVETGDATPARAASWIGERNAFRNDAAVYCELNSLPDLFAATSHAGRYRLIVASWDSSTDQPRLDLPKNVTLLGKQFISTAQYDESVIYDDSWHPVKR